MSVERINSEGKVNLIKKILSLILILLSFAFSQTAIAPSVGDGTESNPYQIATLENLYWISADSSNWDKHFIQIADIDASETENWFDGKGWLPIATTSSREYFTGSYNGKNNIICGLFINRSDEFNIGLFSHINHALIENISLNNMNIAAAAAVGGIVGTSWSSILRNCYTSGMVTYVKKEHSLEGDQIGGMIGGSIGTSIDSCSSSASVNGGICTGGLIGYTSSDSVINCSSYGNVDGLNMVGGLVGTSFSFISESHNNATVVGKSSVGGIAGMSWGWDGENYIRRSRIFKCYNKGKITGINKIGGIVGWVYGAEIKNCYNLAKISGSRAGGLVGEMSSVIMGNSYNAGDISGGSSGLIAYQDYPKTYDDCFWDIDLSGQTTSAGGIGKTTDEMKSLSTYLESNWDFSEIWIIDTSGVINQGYPYLLWSENIISSVHALKPSDYILKQNYPNPFNPTTTISYQLSDVSDVNLMIFDISGRKIKQWSYQSQSSGSYEVTWDGKNLSGNSVPSGVYIYRMVAGGFVESKKMEMLK